MSSDDKNKPTTVADKTTATDEAAEQILSNGATSEELVLSEIQEIGKPETPNVANPVGGLLGALSLDIGVMIGVDPNTMKLWADAKKQEGEDNRYVIDSKKEIAEKECATREKEAAATVDVAVATHEKPAKETTKQTVIITAKEVMQYVLIMLLCAWAMQIAKDNLKGPDLVHAIGVIVGVFSAGIGGVTWLNRKKPEKKE